MHVTHRGGRIPPQVAAVKALASALCIGGGGSVGREGPIVQIGSALGSTLGRLVRVPEPAAGAGGLRRGRRIAATFNAPLAGVFFAMELILADFAAQAFGMVVLSSVTASVIGRAALGDTPFLDLPAFRVAPPAGVPAASPCSACSPASSASCFTRVLYAIEDLCDWAVAGTGVAAAGRRVDCCWAAAAGAPPDVRRRLPGPGQRRRRAATRSGSWCSCWSARWWRPA